MKSATFLFTEFSLPKSDSFIGATCSPDGAHLFWPVKQHIYCYNTNGEFRWGAEVPGNKIEGLQATEDTLYVITLDGIMHAYNIDDGKHQWEDLALNPGNPKFLWPYLAVATNRGFAYEPQVVKYVGFDAQGLTSVRGLMDLPICGAFASRRSAYPLLVLLDDDQAQYSVWEVQLNNLKRRLISVAACSSREEHGGVFEGGGDFGEYIVLGMSDAVYVFTPDGVTKSVLPLDTIVSSVSMTDKYLCITGVDGTIVTLDKELNIVSRCQADIYFTHSACLVAPGVLFANGQGNLQRLIDNRTGQSLWTGDLARPAGAYFKADDGNTVFCCNIQRVNVFTDFQFKTSLEPQLPPWE